MDREWARRPFTGCGGGVIFLALFNSALEEKENASFLNVNSNNKNHSPNNPPDITPGIISGKVTFMKVFMGVLPKLAAALVTL